MVLMADSSAKDYATQHFSMLTPALAELCRTRPEDPVTWLAQYLLAHKPPPPVAPASPQEKLLRVLFKEGAYAEPKITQLLTRISEKFEGAVLIDLDHKFKTAASMVLKFNRFVRNYMNFASGLTKEQAELAVLELHTIKPGRPPMPIIVDAMRYTMLIPTESYAQAAKAVRAELSGPSNGFEQIDDKNFWHGTQTYRGINDIYAMPLGDDSPTEAIEFFFEVQMHTPESIALKKHVHPLMKRMQNDGPFTDEAKQALIDEMTACVNACPVPPGALDLNKKVVRPLWFGK